jgi:type IV pilus assembly protein PilC
MTTFLYTALDSKGKLFRGQVKEKSWTQALRRVKEMGLFPTSVKEHERRTWHQHLEAIRPPLRTRTVQHASGALIARGGVPPKVLTAFTRQLATLLEAGIPLLRALRSTREQEESRRMAGLLDRLVIDIEGGCSFSEALSRHPKVFSRIYLSMVRAGEASGTLETALARLAQFMERAARLRGKIKSALIYPCAVIFVAFAILTGLSIFVIPRFREVFADLSGRGLPLFTEYVLNAAQIFKDNILYIGAFIVAYIATYKLTQMHAAGRLAIDRAKLKLPVIGRIARKVAIARFARILGTLLQNGVPVLQALNIARATATNVVLAQAIQHTHDRVQDGDTLCVPLKASGVFPSTVLSMIDVGEQSGALPQMLLKIADNYDEEVDNSVAAAMSLLEPVLIIFLALIVGAVVIALFLPIKDIITGGFENDSL